jgi:predicted nucleic acid-binding Zn ribbon protein
MITKSPQPLETVLDSLIQNLGLGNKIQQYQIFELWNDIVGEQVARVTSVERIDNGVVTIKVAAAPWRTELVFRKQEILEKIHHAMNSTLITDIRFR